MLGKLFNLGAATGTPGKTQPSASRYIPTLESVQEDIHTRCLLFPDAHTLHQHRNDQVFPLSTSIANPFDLDADSKIDARHVRVIIMQDTSSSSPASLLYDSQPLYLPPTVPSPDPSQTVATLSLQRDIRRFPASQRKSSADAHHSRPVVVQPGSPQPCESALDGKASMHSRIHSMTETDSERAMREYKQEIDTFSACVFGNNEFLAYKGTSTKVHVVPSDLRRDLSACAPSSDSRASVGRLATRTSKLSQSFSSDSTPSFRQSVSPALPHSSDRRRILITRLFPVSLPADDTMTGTFKGRSAKESAECPPPPLSDKAKAAWVKKAQPRQKRTPMYAVALIIGLPPSAPPSAPASAMRAAFRGPSSYTENQDSLPSSYNSARRSGRASIGSNLGGYDAFDLGFSLESEEGVDAITRHWDVIMRTLTSLQSIVATEIFSLLKLADMASPDRFNANQNYRPVTIMKFVSLPPNCFADDRHIKSEIDAAKTRIVSGLQATRVVTGQNRWGIWREEARWVGKWASRRNQRFFFFNLLSGFLSVHTDWLQALSPSRYRRQFAMLQKMKGEDDLSLPARTIIVSQDRIAARRLIFLLSAFLPANQQVPALRSYQPPHISASFGGFSHSPPSFVVPLTKEESLRRKINQRPTPRQNSHPRNASIYSTHTKGAVPAHLAHLSMDSRRERRASDTLLPRTTHLPFHGTEYEMRKGRAAMAADVAAVTKETSTIIPHFTTQRSDTQQPYGRRETSRSSSMAAEDLRRTLKRGDSAGSSDNQATSRWGSVMSGFWTTGRRDSRKDCRKLATPPNRAGLAGRDEMALPPQEAGANGGNNSPGTTAQETASMEAKNGQTGSGDAPSGIDAVLPQTPPSPSQDEDGMVGHDSLAPIPVDRTPDPNGAFESPVKTTINAEDGVIDVDVPFTDFITSFETAVSSPSSSGYLSNAGLSGLELFEQACRVAMDEDVPMNVAGWLHSYHPDFILQAIPPQKGLMEQVRASLRAEPTPHSSALLEGGEERWVDVSSALIADSTDFSIRRIRYRRLVKARVVGETNAPLLSSSVNTISSAALTPMVSPYAQHLREEFIEDPIVAMDNTLIEAVERVIAQNKEGPQASSRPIGKQRESFVDVLTAAIAGASMDSTGAPEAEKCRRTMTTTTKALTHPPRQQEVPRGECKTVVLSALESVARDVVQSRDEGVYGGRSADAGHGSRKKDSVLREAVRNWVDGVDADTESTQ